MTTLRSMSHKTRGRAFWIPVFAGMTLLSFGFFAQVDAAESSKVDPVLCRALTQHTPRADVAYQGGVDVYGKPVIPADLPDQPQVKLPDQIKIPLTFNLAKLLNLDTSVYPYNRLGESTEAQLGELIVEGSSVLLNGKPISDAQQERLAVLCLKVK